MVSRLSADTALATSTPNGIKDSTVYDTAVIYSEPAPATEKPTCPVEDKHAHAPPATIPEAAKSKSKSNTKTVPHESTQGGGLKGLLALRQASKRPLPTQLGNGQYRVVETWPKFGTDLKALRRKDIKTIIDIIKNKLTGNGVVDDKTMIMERTIQLVANLPHRSRLREELTNNFINELWDSLDHPPLLYVGKHSYRTADGSYNNILYPSLGAAGTYYARSVRPGKAPLGALPDPGQVFDAVMGRREFRKHPNNVSSVLWYWATIIIHDLFWSDPTDGTKSKTSSYLDLSPLYGSNQEMQDSIRTFKDGKLKPDAYADKRLIGMPPGVSVLLIMFNRFHNHAAENLALINENGRFTKPSPTLPADKAAAAWKQYDEDLFQTARLVTSGLYINITLVDYVRNIINLNRVDTTWCLDPRQEMGLNAGTKDGAERGVGNVVSAEFNLCYRWHSCISERDEKWIQDFYGDLFANKAKTTSSQDMFRALGAFEQSIPIDPGERTFNGYQRNADGKFNDDDLVDCISAAIEDCAGSFGARNVPQAMRPVEILGILRGRKWNLAGLNEFRKHFGLKPYDTFEEINSDPGVADQLRNLYQHPDYVELYPGIVAEEFKSPMVPGVGIAPTYTISRVVLSDAVCLVRGDRFYTTDYHPGNLTTWGYKEVDYDLNVNHGCVFYKLFIRAFPNHFKYNSVYAHYPMVIPSENKQILRNLKRDHLFDFEQPKFSAPRVNITSYGGAVKVLEDQQKYRVTWGEGLSFLMGNGGSQFMLSGDTSMHAEQRRRMATVLYRDGWREDIKAFYAATVERLFAQKSYDIAGVHQVDIIRDVGNLSHVHFASCIFALPLKTEENKKGIFTEQEMYRILSAIFICIFFDLDPAKSFPLRQMAKEACLKLGKAVELNVKMAKFGLPLPFTKYAKGKEPLASYSPHVVKALSKMGLSAYDIAWSHILPTAGAMVPNQAEVFAQAVDFFLSKEGSKYVADIHKIATQDASEGTNALLLGYAMEGIRLAGTFGSYREATGDGLIVEDDGRQVPVKTGDRVFVSFVDAARDPARFPEPLEVNPRRPLDSYLHYGKGPHICLGRDISQVAITELFRAVFRRKNVRRAPGAQGQLKKIPRPGGFYVYLTEDGTTMTPFPATMKIQWDE